MLIRYKIIILTIYFLLGSFSWCPAALSHYNLFVIVYEENPVKIYQLKILPDGQIIDPQIQYTLPDSGNFPQVIAITNNYHNLYVGTDVLHMFQIKSDGNLYSLGTIATIGTGVIAITPNNKLLILSKASGPSFIFSITSTGDLVNMVLGPGIAIPKADPLGRGILAISSIETSSAYTIDYINKTLHETTTFLINRHIMPYGFNYTHDGKLGFCYGDSAVTPSGGDLLVLKIDSAFNVTTTQVFDIPSQGIDDVAVSNNNHYVWASAFFGGIVLYSIDSLGNLTDTGKKYNKGGTRFIRKTPDERFMVAGYEDSQLPAPGGAFATAWIHGDGSLTWTGYSFAFDSVHPSGSTIQDAVIVPVYVTDVGSF
jgi:hypothetical protein